MTDRPHEVLSEKPVRLCVVIPAYQGGAALHACLKSVVSLSLLSLQTIVVDNASTDGSVDSAEELFPEITFLRNKTNRGFGKACNQGISLAMKRGVEMVLLLNQDAQLDCRSLCSMVDLIDRTPEAGVVGCRTFSGDPEHLESARLLYGGAWKSWLPLWQRVPGIGQSYSGTSDPPMQVDYVWGHTMMLRCAALREAGSFDPGFFMYYEDLELCERFKKNGWQIWCDTQAVSWHHIDDPSRAGKSELWRWKMKQESCRHCYRLQSYRLPSDLLWLLTAAREGASLVRHGYLRAAWHLLIAVLGAIVRSSRHS
jgi:GT2 family glycosyltransferase